MYFCRTLSPLSTEATTERVSITQTYQLWAAVSSALCGCVNNPQNGNVGTAQFKWIKSVILDPRNSFQVKSWSIFRFLFGAIVLAHLCVHFCLPEEGQRICVAVFPIIKIWLQQIALPRTEIFQPICSFIAMTVANNCRWKKQNRNSWICHFLWIRNKLQIKMLIASLQPVFRRLFLPQEVWILSLSHWFVKPLRQPRVCCHASFLSLY